ncbi:MAG TPA: enoyl-[acyl-carrier-protein] reductase FabK [Syntrophomonadaceae bacterium]|nr:enoyl-[acyl-carrier-protein] reductase FabK [Syntrophomonadaceae bacterium]
MIKTVLCDLLSIDYPILQGGMAWVATAELAAAVSEAGALGIIAAGGASPETVQAEIRKVRSLTKRPFGVNIGLFSPHVDGLMELVVAERVPVITTGAGNPGKYLPQLKEAGIKVIPVVASVALAKRLERAGVDALIAEGMESGGHIGEITTMALVPQIVDAVSIPVIAAGGIADGRGLAAALALGAVGVQIGTRFICATECTAHTRYKNAIIAAGDRDTTVTGYPGHYVRVLRNKLTRRYEELIRQGATEEELNQLGVNKLRAAVVDGDVIYGSVMAGQSAALVKKIEPAVEIVRSIAGEAEEVLKRLGAVVNG